MAAAPGLHVAGGTRPAQTLRGSVSNLEQLASQLIEELERITLPFSDHAPCDAELRIAQTQLDDWLERLSGGIQAELFALQMAAQQRLLNIADLAAASARCRATNAGQDRGPRQGPDAGMPGPDRIGQGYENIWTARTQIPDEFANKALRYGWPAGAAYLPTLVGVGSDGPSDLAGADAQRLQMALAAVLAIDSRGPVLAEARATTGRVALADGAYGDFVITQ